MRRADHRGQSGWGHLAAGMILLALLLRVIVPAGWMPDTTSRGFRIILCSGSGPMPMPMPMMMGHHGTAEHGKAPQPANQSDHPCTFAGLSAALIGPAELPALLRLPFEASPTAFVMGIVAIGRGLAAPPPPPTGPPVSL